METPTEKGCNLSTIDQTLPAEIISYICIDFVPHGSIHLEVLRRQHINDRIFGKQECIPVGCIPVTYWLYARVCFPGGCLLQGVSALGGVCSWGCLLGGVCSGGMSALGGCLLWGVCSRGVSTPGGVCSQGVSALGGLLGGCLLQGCVCSWGWYPSMHWGRHPPMNRMTDRCKNITLTTTLLWPVKKVNSRLISVDRFLTVNVYRLILLTYASALGDRLAVSLSVISQYFYIKHTNKGPSERYRATMVEEKLHHSDPIDLIWP